MALAASLLSVVLLRRLALRMTVSERITENATWILLGMVYFAAFSSAIVFDVLLTTCVLLGLHAALDLDARNIQRGVVLLALSIALGVLAKGPVILLHIAFPLLFAPYWSNAARENKLR